MAVQGDPPLAGHQQGRMKARGGAATAPGQRVLRLTLNKRRKYQTSWRPARAASRSWGGERTGDRRSQHKIPCTGRRAHVIRKKTKKKKEKPTPKKNQKRAREGQPRRWGPNSLRAR